jgi:glycerophosphoryl diester phosphodiesterase
MQSQGLEFDIQLSSDGVPVVLHDENLQRTTGIAGQVANFSWEQLQSLDAGSWMGETWAGEKIPSLEQVLTEFNDLFLNIELKNSVLPYPGLEEKVIELVFRYCNSANVIISSFNHQSVQRVKKLAPILKTGVLYEREPANAVEYVKSLGASAAHPDFKLLTRQGIEQYHAAGLQVNTWTVNTNADMERLIQMKVDGIITNHPHRLHSLLTSPRRHHWQIPGFPRING